MTYKTAWNGYILKLVLFRAISYASDFSHYAHYPDFRENIISASSQTFCMLHVVTCLCKLPFTYHKPHLSSATENNHQAHSFAQPWKPSVRLELRITETPIAKALLLPATRSERLGSILCTWSRVWEHGSAPWSPKRHAPHKDVLPSFSVEAFRRLYLKASWGRLLYTT